MPTPRHLIVRPIGQSPNGETWTFGLRFTHNLNGSNDLSNDQLQAIADAVAGVNSGSAIPAQMKSMLSSSLAVAGVRVEQIGTDGRLEKAAEHLYSPVVPGVDPPQRTIQTALVFSLNRGAQFGRSGRGRVYVPACGVYPTQTAGFRVQSNQMEDVLSMFNQMQGDWGQAINGEVGLLSYQLCVYSPKLEKLTAVENVALGDVFDSQRRRRDKWVEARVVQPRI